MSEINSPTPNEGSGDDQNDLGIPGVAGLVEIGRGGFGIVYRGVESSFQRDVAVKVLPSAVDPAARERFERERLATGTLSGHPNIVTVFRGGFTGAEQPYLVMEYLPGGSLGDRLKSFGALPWVEVTEIGVKLAGALETAHRAGVLHRDIKPGNVFQSGLGEPKLGDFGIARLQGGSETQSSAVTASIVHAPPEVISGQRPDHRSDIYALASTLYELLSGSAAFAVDDEESLVPMLARIATSDAVAPVVDGAAGPVVQAILRAMKKQPEDRFESAAGFGEALQEAQLLAGLPQTPLLVEGAPIPMPGEEFGSASTLPASQHTQQIPAPTSDDAQAPLSATTVPTSEPTTALTPMPAAVPPPTPMPPTVMPPTPMPPTPVAPSVQGPLSMPVGPAVERPNGNRSALLVALGAFALFVAGLAGWAVTRTGDGGGVGQEVGSDVVTTISAEVTSTQPASKADSLPAVTIAASTPTVPATTSAPVTAAPVTTTPVTTTPVTAAPPLSVSPIVSGDPLPVDFTENGVQYSEYTHADGAITMTVPTSWTGIREDAFGHPEYAILDGLQPYVGVSIGLSHAQLGADAANRDYGGSGIRVTASRGPAGQDVDVLMDYEVAKFANCGDPGDRLDFFIAGAGVGRSQFYIGCDDQLTSTLVTVVVHDDDPTVYTTVITQFSLGEISEFDRQSDVVIDPTKVPTT